MDLSPQASLVQLVERRSPKPDVRGSSPRGRAGLFKTSTQGFGYGFSRIKSLGMMVFWELVDLTCLLA